MVTRNDAEIVAGLIPEYWDLTARTRKDIVFLGKVTIREMIRSWRYHAKELGSSIKERDELLKFLQGKTAADFRKLAEKFENPEFPHVGVQKDSWGNDPEPLDAASINRESGKTTFNVCGWCKYAGCGTCRYNYHITTVCDFKTRAGLKDEERRFNTPCFLKDVSDEMLAQIRNGLSRERDRLISEKRQADFNIGALLSLEDRAAEKPALPDRRPHDWFNVDDPVVCYIGKWQERIVKDQFATAKVINGYRHHDGCVSVCFDQRVHSGEYLEGRGSGYGMARPEVMHKWEFEYLLKHPDFARLWATQGVGKHLDGFDSKKFLAVLAKFTKI